MDENIINILDEFRNELNLNDYIRDKWLVGVILIDNIPSIKMYTRNSFIFLYDKEKVKDICFDLVKNKREYFNLKFEAKYILIRIDIIKRRKILIQKLLKKKKRN